MITTAEEAIAAIHKRFGVHAGRRALHAKGTLCTGTFVATAEAGALTKAAHMQGTEIPVLARVSNGGGNPKIPDYDTDVRGLAVSFELPDGSRTDIVSQTSPRFPFKDTRGFFDLLAVSKPAASSLVKLPVFLVRHARVVPVIAANLGSIKPPASYASVPYYAIHAYRWTAADGSERYVRYTWEPQEPVERLSRSDAKKLGRDYLQEEIAERLVAGPARFDLMLQIAAEGDDPDDPSSVWSDNKLTKAGTMTLTATTSEGDSAIFDPIRVTDGIEPSNDPVLQFRPAAYSESYALRTA